jgi:hypothetical protein
MERWGAWVTDRPTHSEPRHFQVGEAIRCNFSDLENPCKAAVSLNLVAFATLDALASFAASLARRSGPGYRVVANQTHLSNRQSNLDK